MSNRERGLLRSVEILRRGIPADRFTDLPIRTGQAGDDLPDASGSPRYRDGAGLPPVESRVVPTRRYQFANGVSVDRRAAVSGFCVIVVVLCDGRHGQRLDVLSAARRRTGGFGYLHAAHSEYSHEFPTLEAAIDWPPRRPVGREWDAPSRRTDRVRVIHRTTYEPPDRECLRAFGKNENKGAAEARCAHEVTSPSSPAPSLSLPPRAFLPASRRRFVVTFRPSNR